MHAYAINGVKHCAIPVCFKHTVRNSLSFSRHTTNINYVAVNI